MKITVINKFTNEVIASLDTDKEDCGFCNEQHEVIIAENEPVFEMHNGIIFLKRNSFVVDMRGEQDADSD